MIRKVIFYYLLLLISALPTTKQSLLEIGAREFEEDDFEMVPHFRDGDVSKNLWVLIGKVQEEIEKEEANDHVILEREIQSAAELNVPTLEPAKQKARMNPELLKRKRAIASLLALLLASSATNLFKFEKVPIAPINNIPEPKKVKTPK